MYILLVVFTCFCTFCCLFCFIGTFRKEGRCLFFLLLSIYCSVKIDSLRSLALRPSMKYFLHELSLGIPIVSMYEARVLYSVFYSGENRPFHLLLKFQQTL